VYGIVPPERLPTAEDAPLDPVNPYAVSKAAQDLLAGQYAHRGLDVVRIRPFNHLGAGQDPRIVAAGFARQIAEIELGIREPVVLVGNLAAERDFTDVRDTVKGYLLASLNGERGAVYNLGTGVSHSAREILDFMCAASSVAVRVEADPARLRPSDNPRTLCDAGRAREKLGWEASIPFETTLTDVLEDWRTRVRQEQSQ
jgi:GDP-4-dehydro-6-deoxy-D-mannose reductase